MHERFNDISILRCSAMLMIVFYHCLCAYGVWDDAAYSADLSVPLWDVFIAIMRNIHLPLFFIIAGFYLAISEFWGVWKSYEIY
jgi:Acyltransferase family.